MYAFLHFSWISVVLLSLNRSSYLIGYELKKSANILLSCIVCTTGECYVPMPAYRLFADASEYIEFFSAGHLNLVAV